MEPLAKGTPMRSLRRSHTNNLKSSRSQSLVRPRRRVLASTAPGLGMGTFYESGKMSLHCSWNRWNILLRMGIVIFREAVRA